jgi:hypothetical protein
MDVDSYMVYMDENGDAAGNYSIIGRRPHHLSAGEYGLYPVGLFTLAGITPVSHSHYHIHYITIRYHYHYHRT